MKHEITPATKWPVGRRVVLLDAFMANPIEVKITRHWNADHVGTEDDRGVVYYARTDRITGFAANDQPGEYDDFADILG